MKFWIQQDAMNGLWYAYDDEKLKSLIPPCQAILGDTDCGYGLSELVELLKGFVDDNSDDDDPPVLELVITWAL